MTGELSTMAARIAERLGGAKRNGDGWMARCPAHDDRNPSLSINSTADRLLFHCHAGCAQEAVIGRLKGLGLWGRDQKPNSKWKVVTTYAYTDGRGKLLHQTVRYAPKGFRQRRPDGNGGWVWNLKGIQTVLYRLPRVLPAKHVYLCEGEKDVRSAEGLGCTATCNPMGAGKWRPQYTEVLKGKMVFILPDNDDPGREHAEAVAFDLHRAGIPCKIVELPGLPDKGDVTDWVNAGGTRRRLVELVNAAAWYKPRFETAVPNADNTQDQAPEAGTLVTVRAADVETRPISWLWPDRIARGKLTVIAGDPGLAKSTITISMAAVVTGKGRWGMRYWPDGARCGVAGSVVFLSAEDDAEDTLRPRLEAAGAGLERIHIVQSVLTGYMADGEPAEKLFSLQTDLRALEKKLAELGDVSLLVIDPVTAYLDGIDSYKNSEVRGVLAPLRALANKHDVAVVLITHMNKDSAKALMGVSGSLAFVAAARAVYLVVEDPHDPQHQRRLVLPVKHNLGPAATGLAYTVESAEVRYPGGEMETARIAWQDTTVNVTAQEALMRSRKVSPDEEKLGSKEREVVELLAFEGKLKPAEIAEKLKWVANNTYAVLQRLRERKKIVKQGGCYALPEPE